RNRLRTSPLSQNYGARVRFLRQLGDIEFEFRPRLQIDRVSHTLSFSSSSQYKNMTFDPVFELFGKSDTGTGQFLGLNLSFLVDDSNSFVIVNDQQYVDGDNRFSTNHGGIWNYKFDALTRT